MCWNTQLITVHETLYILWTEHLHLHSSFNKVDAQSGRKVARAPNKDSAWQNLTAHNKLEVNTGDNNNKNATHKKRVVT